MNEATETTHRTGRPTSAGASRGDFCLPKFWSDRRKLKILGMGTALPGQPVSTRELLARIEKRFGVEVSLRGAALANRLKIDSRYLCRDFEERREVPRMDELLGSFLGIEPARVFVNADRLGNTGSAAIWLALADLRSALEPGASVLALGAEATKYMFGGFHYVHG